MNLQIDSVDVTLTFSCKVGTGSISGIRNDNGTLEKAPCKIIVIHKNTRTTYRTETRSFCGRLMVVSIDDQPSFMIGLLKSVQLAISCLCKRRISRNRILTLAGPSDWQKLRRTIVGTEDYPWLGRQLNVGNRN